MLDDELVSCSSSSSSILLWFIIMFFVSVIPMVLQLIAKKKKYSKLSENGKLVFNTAKEKVKSLRKKINLITLACLIIVFLLLFFSISYAALIESEASYNSTSSNLPVVSNSMGSFVSEFLTITSLLAIAYVLISTISYKIFFSSINKNSNLTDDEKKVLNYIYGGSIIPLWLSGVIYFIGSTLIRFMMSTADKPIIYLYPKKKQKVKVKVSDKDKLIHTYPKYDNEWNVEADVDGTLTAENGRKYYALYYEGKNNVVVDEKVGFCVKGKDTISFLEEKLELLGLNEREAEEFIVYWLPQMENNKYNYVYFKQTEEVNEVMGLDIDPKPDTLIRILMYFKPLNKEIEIKPQEIITPKRTGFTVVEWGGTKIK